MILKQCRKCGEPTGNRPAVCDECQAKEPEQKREAARYYDTHLRDSRSAAFYRSAVWIKLRLAKLLSIGFLCEDCQAEVAAGLRDPDDVQVATEVHHEKPIAEYWHLRLAWNNLRGLCAAHHMAKRKKTQGGGRSGK